MTNSLTHYGILGMRWGIRRDQSNDSSGRKHIREMTNAELKERIDRALLEKQYRDVTKKETSPGQKFISEVLATSGKQVASVYVSKLMTSGVEAILKQTVKP